MPSAALQTTPILSEGTRNLLNNPAVAQASRYLELSQLQLRLRFAACAEGLNLSRVTEFIRRQNMALKPFVLFSESEQDCSAIKALTGRRKLVGDKLLTAGSNVRGQYSPELDLAFVRRVAVDESLNGALHTEGLLVHELAHASGIQRGYYSQDGAFYKPIRSGFVLHEGPRSGEFLEEAWAEMQRAQYVCEHADPAWVARLNVVAGTERLGLEDSVTFVPNDILLNGIRIEFKYLRFSTRSDATFVVPPSSFAGSAMELLCRNNQELKELLLHARTDPDALGAVARSINRMRPGLYSMLRQCRYNNSDFMRTANFIFSEFGK